MPPSQAADIAPTGHSRIGGRALTAVAPGGRVIGLRTIPRPAVVQKLIEARDKPLALIVAPPGYGKSVLLAEWEQRDPREFVRLPPNSTAAQLIHLIGAVRPGHRDVVIVLDRAERLEQRALQDLVETALGALVPGSTLALASRREPPLALGRLRAHQLLAEVRTPDLALGPAECETLLSREGPALSPADVEALLVRTEGWPAALYLAALSAREAPEEVSSFSGEQHLMFEYVRDTVVADLPGAHARFAAQTSVLEEMSGPLCDAVLQQRGSGVLLDEVARLTPLLAPVDANHRHYRWHRLVREALRADLHRTEPELEAELHRRASGWYLEAGETRAAIDHAARAEDAALTGDLLCENLVTYLSHGGGELIDGWLRTVGAHRAVGYAPLALAASFRSLAAGRLEEAKRWSIAADAALQRGRGGPNRRSVSTGLAVLRALSDRTGLAGMGELATSAIEGEPPDSQWRPVCLFLRGVSAHLRGDGGPATKILDEAVAVNAEAAPSFAALCLAQRAMIALESRDWDTASELTERAAMVTEEWNLRLDPNTALVFAAMAAARAHAGRLAEAKRDLRHGVDLLAALGDYLPWYGAEARILLAHASLWLADVVGARSLLAEASRLARKTPDAVVFARWFDRAWEYMDTLAETRLAGPSSLTIAELRILRFLPSHRSFREIAAQLDVSANTVKTQAHAVYRKLGAASRSEAVARAIEAGLLG